MPKDIVDIEYTKEFEKFWLAQAEETQNDIAAHVTILEERGTRLGYRYSSKINGSRHPQMRELRVQLKGRQCRIFYAVDPRRAAILLIGGDKTGDDWFFQKFIPKADHLYSDH
ncbi:MAG: type II toxin-antitoxin system RelE/ParE family toxin [Pseudomonadota bacterium]